jgi:tripartite-type tricarboxylate transporter receptor subunit TctC
VAPPGVPADHLAILRAAFDATMKHPAFLADAKKVKMMVEPMTSAGMDALLKQAYGSPKPVVTRAAELIATGTNLRAGAHK